MRDPELGAGGLPQRSSAISPAGRPLDALKGAGPPLLFGVRLWLSVCLALYVAFSLELDNAYWAGTSAAIVCQPHLGASLRKGWYRMIGTVVGAVAIVVLTACFPQDRASFLVGLASWGAGCALVATLLKNFAVLPNFESFAAFSLAIGLVLVPAGAGMAQPWQTAMFTAIAANFVPILGPANQQSYDTQQFYNAASAIVAGVGAAACSFRLIPPLSPAFRTRRLLALALRDLRRLARGPDPAGA
jgi:uncharacterized membrane protein YccC